MTSENTLLFEIITKLHLVKGQRKWEPLENIYIHDDIRSCISLLFKLYFHNELSRFQSSNHAISILLRYKLYLSLAAFGNNLSVNGKERQLEDMLDKTFRVRNPVISTRQH